MTKNKVIRSMQKIAEGLENYAATRHRKWMNNEPMHTNQIAILAPTLGELPRVLDHLKRYYPNLVGPIREKYDKLVPCSERIDKHLHFGHTVEAQQELQNFVQYCYDLSVSLNDTAAEIKQNAAINVSISGDVQAENLQIGHDSSIQKQTVTGEKKGGRVKKILKIIAAIVAFLAALFTCIGYLLGWLGPIKEFIYKMMGK